MKNNPLLPLDEEIKDKSGNPDDPTMINPIVECHLNLAILHRVKKMYDQAMFYAKKAANLCVKHSKTIKKAMQKAVAAVMREIRRLLQTAQKISTKAVQKVGAHVKKAEQSLQTPKPSLGVFNQQKTA